jgi:hypothetical protein
MCVVHDGWQKCSACSQLMPCYPAKYVTHALMMVLHNLPSQVPAAVLPTLQPHL